MRRTTSYLLKVWVPEGNPNPVADRLVADFPGDVEASGVGPQFAFIRYRTNSDQAALDIALEMGIVGEWELSRGYGIHKEVVHGDAG